MNLELGEIIKLDSEEEYIVFNKERYKGEEYLFIMTTSKPIHIQIIQEKVVDEEITIEFVEEPELIQELIKQMGK